jgi:hypothetical protein
LSNKSLDREAKTGYNVPINVGTHDILRTNEQKGIELVIAPGTEAILFGHSYSFVSVDGSEAKIRVGQRLKVHEKIGVTGLVAPGVAEIVACQIETRLLAANHLTLNFHEGASSKLVVLDEGVVSRLLASDELQARGGPEINGPEHHTTRDTLDVLAIGSTNFKLAKKSGRISVIRRDLHGIVDLTIDGESLRTALGLYMKTASLAEVALLAPLSRDRLIQNALGAENPVGVFARAIRKKMAGGPRA